MLGTRRRATPPNYYSAAKNATLTIPQETEDALILAPAEEKRKASEYLRLMVDADGGSDDHDEALGKFVDKQTAVKQALTDTLSRITKGFDEFKDKLVGSARDPVFVTGFAPLLSSMIKGLGTVKRESDSAEFHNRVAKTAKAFYGERLTDRDRRELRSWIRVLLSYP